MQMTIGSMMIDSLWQSYQECHLLKSTFKILNHLWWDSLSWNFYLLGNCLRVSFAVKRHRTTATLTKENSWGGRLQFRGSVHGNPGFNSTASRTGFSIPFRDTADTHTHSVTFKIPQQSYKWVAFSQKTITSNFSFFVYMQFSNKFINSNHHWNIINYL